MIIGDRTPGSTAVELATNTKTVARFLVPQTGILGKLTAFLDGLGSGAGTALIRGVLYAADGSLVAVSDEVSVHSGMSARWVDLPFASIPGGAFLPTAGSDFDIGLLVGGDTNVARVFVEPWTAGGKRNANTYTAGPSDPFGSATSVSTDLAVYGIAVAKFVPNPDADEFYYGRLPFVEAQRVFSSTVPVKNSATPATLSWHGTSVDVERGSFAVVRANGPFDLWIGERLKITMWQQKGLPRRAVYAFAHNYAALKVDLSVPRRVWASLAPAGIDWLSVTVEKLV